MTEAWEPSCHTGRHEQRRAPRRPVGGPPAASAHQGPGGDGLLLDNQGADVLHVGLGIPDAVSTAFYSVVLAMIFVLWYRSEGTLSIHSIYTRRRELFYWATVLATFALGTAAGDLTAKVVGLGYLGSGVMFAVVIAIPYVGYRWFGLNPIVAFWFAYIVTRPLGASFADWLAWPPSAGGLGLGHGMVSLVSTVIIIGLVGYMAATRKDVMVRG